MIRQRTTRWMGVLALIFVLSLGDNASAQNIRLSAEQQSMLNQLPPAQRQQALDALRQLDSRESSVSQTINEPISTSGEVGPKEIVVGQDELRVEGRSHLVIKFVLREDLSSTNRQRAGRDPIIRRLLGSHFYALDRFGVLELEGLPPIPLLGLSEDDVKQRLEAEPYLADLNINARILSREPVGMEALKPFGYELFDQRGTTLAPPISGPVPQDYVLGPGDTVRVQLYGNVNGIFEYEVSRDGVLNLPEIGPVTVAGIPFSEFRQDLHKRVQEMLIGTQVSVTMGQLRTIRVFLLGDVNQPGSYVVSGLATMSSALYQGGGVSKVGSLRDIQLKRNGNVVSRLDLYDLLLSGDTSSDNRLQPGDVIFVPPVGAQIAVGGAVKRPAIYEMKGKATVSDAIKVAGGLTSDAFGGGVRLERIKGSRKTLGVDLSNQQNAALALLSGDTLFVPELLPEFDATVILTGHVYRPGNYEWRPGMRLTDLISSRDQLMPGVDTGYVLIRREIERGKPIQVVSADLGAALASPGSKENIALQAADTIHVFSMALGRQSIVEPLLEELRLQATIDEPVRRVQVYGDVRAPGPYPLEENMRVSDLIRAGGSLSEAAYAYEAELTRYSTLSGDSREVDVIKVDLRAIRQGDSSADLVLKEHDYLIINRVPEWDVAWTVSVQGEVRFPGEYRVRRGETLGDVLQRAGGLTEDAFPEGAIFLRESLREREAEQIEMLARRLEADLASLSLQSATMAGGDTFETGRVLLDQLRNTDPVGRLVIHLAGDADRSDALAIELRDGDELLVPKFSQVVSVLGETQQNTSLLFNASLSRDDYIDMSGGLTRRADKRRIYVVRANGAVVTSNRSRWLGRRSSVDIQPGDTIVVPLDADKMRPMTFWTNVTQMLYQGAIAVAAVRSFNN